MADHIAMASSTSMPVGLTLTPDYVTVPNQRFALVSFVGPELPQKNERLGMKIRGVFATEDEAKAHVKRIQDSGDKSVDIFMLEMYNWAVVPPDREAIPDQHFQEEFLQKMMEQRAEANRAAKQHFDERARLVRTEGLIKHLRPEEIIPKPDVEPKFAVDDGPTPADQPADEPADQPADEPAAKPADEPATPAEIMDAMTADGDLWTARRARGHAA